MIFEIILILGRNHQRTVYIAEDDGIEELKALIGVRKEDRRNVFFTHDNKKCTDLSSLVDGSRLILDGATVGGGRGKKRGRPKEAISYHKRQKLVHCLLHRATKRRGTGPQPNALYISGQPLYVITIFSRN